MKDTTFTQGTASFDDAVGSDLREVVIAYKSPGSGFPYPTMAGAFEGVDAKSVEIIESDDQYREIARGSDVEILALPTDAK